MHHCNLERVETVYKMKLKPAAMPGLQMSQVQANTIGTESTYCCVMASY